MPQNGWCPDHNYLVVKYDTNGNQLWNAEYTNSVGDDFVVDIVLDTLGNISSVRQFR